MTATHKVFAVRGMTDDTHVCELCGRDDLTRAVILAELDTEGAPTGDVVYYGTDCAARAAGWTQSEVRRRVRDADRERRAAERREADARHRAEFAAETEVFHSWLLENFGTTDERAIRREWSIPGVLRTKWLQGKTVANFRRWTPEEAASVSV